MRLVILVLLIVVVGGGTLLLTRTWLSLQEDQAPVAQAPVQREQADLFVLVADQTLVTGDLIDRDDVRWQPWPDEDTPPTYYRWTENDGDIEEAVAPLLGTVTTKAFLEGEPILSSALINPGERGFLAAVLRPGYRAVTVDIDDYQALEGLAHPGDFVDVILNHTFTETRLRLDTGEEEDIDHQVAETLLRGVRVLALDRALSEANREGGSPDTVTLEGTPQQVELISLASTMGEITLVLNGIRDPDRLGREQFQIAGLGADTGLMPAGATAGGQTTGGDTISGGMAVGVSASTPTAEPLGPRVAERDDRPASTPTPYQLVSDGALKPGEATAPGLRREIEVALNATPANLGMRATLLRDPHMPVWQLERLMRRATQTTTLSSDLSLFLTPPVSPVERMAGLRDMAPSEEPLETMTGGGGQIMVFRGAPPGGGGGGVEMVDSDGGGGEP